MTARLDRRKVDQLRPVSFVPDIAPAAAGSALVSFGHTRVICAVSLERGVPRWKKEQGETGGWLTAEYSLLPYSTPERNRREVNKGKISGRTQEIQRLIGRSLRAIVDMEALGDYTVNVDCDVLQADGGTRTASITGAVVALGRAVRQWQADGILTKNPIRELAAAVSVGIVEGVPMLDLCYEEDLAASTDMNVVMTAKGHYIEVQGTAEDGPYTPAELAQLLELAGKGIRRLQKLQKVAIQA